MFYLLVLEPTADDPLAETLARGIDEGAQPLSDTAWAVWRKGEGAAGEIMRELREAAPAATVIVVAVSGAAAINPLSSPPAEWGGPWIMRTDPSTEGLRTPNPEGYAE